MDLHIPSSARQFLAIKKWFKCSPSLWQQSFSLLTDCSTADRGKFCGANETTAHRLRGAGRKNCRLTTFHAPCVPVCYLTLDCSSTSISTNSIHPLCLRRQVDDGPLVLNIGRWKQPSRSFHRTKVNLHTNLGEKRRVLVVEELRQSQRYAHY